MTKQFAKSIFRVFDEHETTESWFVEGRSDEELKQYCLGKTDQDCFVLYGFPDWIELETISTPEDLFNYFQGGKRI